MCHGNQQFTFNNCVTKLIFLLKLKDHENFYIMTVEFMEKIIAQNKVIYKTLLKQGKKQEEIANVLLKIHKEDSLDPTFFEVNVKLQIVSILFLGINQIFFF